MIEYAPEVTIYIFVISCRTSTSSNDSFIWWIIRAVIFCFVGSSRGAKAVRKRQISMSCLFLYIASKYAILLSARSCGSYKSPLLCVGFAAW